MNQQFSVSLLASTPSSDLRSLFQTTLYDYEKRTGTNLVEHQLAIDLSSCATTDSIIVTLRSNLQTLKTFRVEDTAVIIKWIKRIARHLAAVSTHGVLGGEGSRVLSTPESALLSAIGILVVTIDDTPVGTNYEMLLDLLKSIELFLRRLSTHIKIPPTAAVTDMVAKILLELLSTLALATQQAKQGRLGKLGEKLLGEHEVEVVLQSLSQAGQQGARTAAAQTLDIIHGLVENMKALIDGGKASADDLQYALIIIQRLASDIIDKPKRDRLLKDIRTWLSPSDPSKCHNIMRKAHHGGTGTWFIEGDGFTEWKNNGSLLWIHGKPGSGKSILCSTIIQEFIRMREAGLASMGYFYFDRENTEMQDARGLVSSLLIQLSEQSELCSEIISRLYSAHATGSVQAGDDALLECLKDMLSIPGQSPIYIILDGLDQSPDDPSARESVLDLVQLLVQLGHPHLHICVFSRIEADIRAVLRPLASQTICLHEQSGQVEDINNYINFFIKTNANTSQWKDEDKEFVIKKVSEEADGMFRWASCRLYQLRRCPPGGILRTLDEFPKIMEVEYERMLQGIHEKQWEASHRLFQCIAVALRPLQVSELAEFLAWDIKQGELPEFKAGWRYEDPEHAVYSACSSFITMTDANECQVVKFSHLSMKEFLSSDRLATSKGGTSRYYVSHEDAHTTVAQGCLATLFYLDEQVNKRSVTNFPLAIYAAQYLAVHAQFQDVQSRIRGALRRLFNGDKPQLSILVWMCNLDEDSGGPMTSETPPQPKATPIYYASLLGLCDIVRCLVYSDGSSVNGNVGHYGSPLIAAAAKGHYDTVMTLLDNGAGPRIEGPGRRTALYSAAENGHLRVVELLLGRRSPPTTFFMRQYSPLGQALRNRHLRVAQLLLQNGARVDTQNGNGETILHQASNGGYDLESVQMLLDNHANTGLKDNQGRTALEIARESGQEEIVRLLLGHDANTMH